MKAYIICFILTILFTYLAQKNFKKEHKKFAIFFSVFAIFIPTFICGIRDISVGRDIEIYVLPVLNRALKSAFFPFLKNFDLESGYMVFVYLISRITNNLNVLLFFIQLIPCLAVFIFAYHYRNEIPMWMVMITYLLTWYLRSYTMMRQSIAVAFILLSILTFEKRKIIPTIILFILAMLFHKTTIVAIGVYFIIWLYDSKKIGFSSKCMGFILIFILMVIGLYSYRDIVYLLYNVGILPIKFVNYLDSNFSNEELQVSASETLFRLVFIILSIIYVIILNKKEKNHKFLKYFLIFLISMGPYLISFKIVNAERMNYYYYYPALLYIVPSLVKIVRKDRFNKTIMSLSLIVILFVFWFFKYPIKKNCETYPYRTSVLKILN